jgi:L-glyceraldehyde 3-phosphate reductase
MIYVPNESRYDVGRFRRSGKSGLVLPPISLGTWQNFGGVNVFETYRAVIRRAFDRGVTHFDLANMYGPPYGSAEENVGRILREDFHGLRDELVILNESWLRDVARSVWRRSIQEVSYRLARWKLEEVGP